MLCLEDWAWAVHMHSIYEVLIVPFSPDKGTTTKGVKNISTV